VVRYSLAAQAVTHARAKCCAPRFNAGMSTLPRTSYIVAYVALLITAVSVAVMAVQPSKRDLSKLVRPGMVATKAAASAMTANQSFTDGMPAAPTSALNGAVIDKAFESPPQVVAQRRK
jgi:hypothetical protein